MTEEAADAISKLRDRTDPPAPGKRGRAGESAIGPPQTHRDSQRRARADSGRVVPSGRTKRATAEPQGTILIRLKVNGSRVRLDADAEMPLLWALRDELGLTGTKYGCGIGACGSCSVLVNGVATRSCLVRVGDVAGEVTTIEGLGSPDAPHPVQEEWIRHQVAQCGYCQSGQIITAVSLLARSGPPTDADIDGAFSNLCRCGTYGRIRQAVEAAAERLRA